MGIIGIDAGTSTIKIIHFNNNTGEITNKQVLKKQPVLNALETFINNEKIDINNVSKIVLTGVGTEEIQNSIYGIETVKVDEFNAIAKGGLCLSNLDKALVVSVGTGTAFVMAEKNSYKHLGGTGVGGGTLLGLLKKMVNISSINEFNEIITKGNLDNVDLKIKDITTKEIPGLSMDTTSSNFGKLKKNASKEDIILGVVNLIFETIGVMSALALKNTDCKDVVVLGNLATLPYIEEVLRKIEKLHNVKFIIPKEAPFGTVIGAIKTVN